MKSFSQIQRLLLLLSMLMSGFCGIIAELSLFNLANTLIGGMNIVLTYTMGNMMFCMGLGALSIRLKWFAGNHTFMFTLVESLLSVLLGTAVPVINLLSGWFPGMAPVWVALYSSAIGCLIGLEIPVILLINESLKQPLRENSAMVFFADYTGSLLAFILFAHVMLNKLGLSHSASLGALLNWTIACIAALTFRKEMVRPIAAFTIVSVSGLTAMLFFLENKTLADYAEQLQYRDGILFKKQTAYQKIVLTDKGLPGNPAYDWTREGRLHKTILGEHTKTGTLSLRKFKSRTEKKDLRLFLNGGLQFSTLDEARYHEMLVHPAAYLTSQLKNVLIGGGGDGMALREILKYAGLEEVVIVDLDPEITRLFRQEPLLCRLNDSAYHDSRVKILNADFFSCVKKYINRFDLVILDFPDPHHNDLAKLYSRQMYKRVKNALRPGGVIATQTVSPFFHHNAFLIIAKTLDSVFPNQTIALKTPMPTFGLWSFHIASPYKDSTEMRAKLEAFNPPVPTVYLNRDMLQAALRWDKQAFKGLEKAPVNEWMKPGIIKAYNEGR